MPLLAFATLVAFINHDEEGFYTITNEFVSDSEALAALCRVGEAIIKMVAEASDASVEEVLEEIGQRIALGDYEDGDDSVV